MYYLVQLEKKLTSSIFRLFDQKKTDEPHCVDTSTPKIRVALDNGKDHADRVNVDRVNRFPCMLFFHTKNVFEKKIFYLFLYLVFIFQ